MASQLLKIIVQGAKIPKIQKNAKYFVTIDAVDEAGSIVGGDTHFQTESVAPDPSPSWNQTILLTVPPEKTYSGVVFKLHLDYEKRTKVIGSVPTVLLSSLPENSVNEAKWFPIEDKPDYSIKIKMGWYGAKNPAIPVQKPGQWGKSKRPIRPSKTPMFSSHSRENHETPKAKLFEAVNTGRKLFLSAEVQKHVAAATKEKNLEIMRLVLEQVVHENKTQKINQRINRLEHALKKYRDIDDEARQLVGGTIDWREVRVQARVQASETDSEIEKESAQKVNLSDDDPPSVYAAFLLTNKELHHLSTIKSKLRTCDGKWLKQFLSGDGLESIHSLLKYIEEQEMTASLSLKEAQVSSFIKTILNNTIACQYVIKQRSETMISIIELILQSKNNLMKVQMCHLFAALCLYGRASHELIFKATKNVGKDKSPPFSSLIYCLKNDKDREIISSTMCLINALIAGEKELGERMKIRSYFTHGDIFQIISDLRKTLPDEQPLMIQFDAFELMLKKDEEELSELRYIGNMDLHNPISLFNQVIHQVESLDLQELLLRHVHQLLMLPIICQDPENAWRFIERSSRRVISSTENEARGTITYAELNGLVHKLIKQEEEKALAGTKRTMWQRAIRPVSSTVLALTPSPPPRPQQSTPSLPNELRPPPSSRPASLSNALPMALQPPTRNVSRGRRKATSRKVGPNIRTQKTTSTWALATPKMAIPEDSIKTVKMPSLPPVPKDQKPPPPPSAINNVTVILDPNWLDPTVPEPQVPMKGLFWDVFSEDLDEYWKDVIPGLETIDTMFQELQDLFYAPTIKKKKKTSLLPVGIANTISTLRDQFKNFSSDSDLIKHLFDIAGNSATMETHHFEALLACIPTDEQIQPLLAYKGPKDELDKADLFVLSLVEIPNIKRKLKTLIFWDEFEIRLASLNTSLQRMRAACTFVLKNKQLKGVLSVMVKVGNFLNSDNVRRTAFQKTPTLYNTKQDTRNPQTPMATTGPTKTLLTYLEGFVTSNTNVLLPLKKEISCVEEAMRYQPSLFQEELNYLLRNINDIDDQIRDISPEEKSSEILPQYYDALSHFVAYAKTQYGNLSRNFSAYEEQSIIVLKSFGCKVEQQQSPIAILYGNFYYFTKQFRTTIEDMHLDEQEEQRREQIKNTSEKSESKKQLLITNKVEEEENGIMDKLIDTTRKGSYFVTSQHVER